jgi:preprotein translocase subunit SecY
VVEAADLRQLAGLKVVVSVCSLVISLILAGVIYLWLSDPLYGIGVANTNSIIFLGVLYGLAAIVYVVARLYRRSQGIDLEQIHAEIPAE